MPTPASPETTYLNELRGRLAGACAEDAALIKARIAEVETRLLSLPQHLPLAVRDEIAMWEGQLAIHSARYGAEADIASIRARIAGLMASEPARRVA
jgi:hypothetical protein